MSTDEISHRSRIFRKMARWLYLAFVHDVSLEIILKEFLPGTFPFYALLSGPHQAISTRDRDEVALHGPLVGESEEHLREELP